MYSTSVLFRYSTLVVSPLFGMLTQLSIIVLGLLALFTLVGVVKHSAFGMNLGVLGCAGVIDGGETIGLSNIEYVDGVVKSALVNMLVLLFSILSYISATSLLK